MEESVKSSPRGNTKLLQDQLDALCVPQEPSFQRLVELNLATARRANWETTLQQQASHQPLTAWGVGVPQVTD